MFPQRTLLRVSQRAHQQLRSPVVRSNSQRRFASTEKLTGPADNAFNSERQTVKHHAAETSDVWRKLSIYVSIPCLIIASVNAWNLWNEHWEHWAHQDLPDERPEYPYMNIRTKNYFWGDGDKTLFEVSDLVCLKSSKR